MSDEWNQACAEVVRGVPGFSQEWEGELRRGAQMKAVQTEIIRKKIAQEESRIERGAVEGLGPLVMQIPLSDYLWAINRWGPGCWGDKSFRESVMKKNPEVRRTYKSKKIMVGFGS